MIHHIIAPRDIQKLGYLPQILLGMQHQLLVPNGQTIVGSGEALIVHALYSAIPFGQYVAVRGYVEAGDGDLSLDYRVAGGAAISDH